MESCRQSLNFCLLSVRCLFFSILSSTYYFDIDIVRQSIGSYPAVIRKLSGSHQAVIRQSSGSYPTLICQMFCSFMWLKAFPVLFIKSKERGWYVLWKSENLATVNFESKFSSQNFFQKTNQRICFSILATYPDRKTNSMVQFLDEVLAGKFVFDFCWP